MNTHTNRTSRIIFAAVTLIAVAAPLAASATAGTGPAPQAIGRVKCC